MTTLQDFIALRETLGLSRREVSLAFGYPENYVWRIESGNRPYRHVLYLALIGYTKTESNAMRYLAQDQGM